MKKSAILTALILAAGAAAAQYPESPGAPGLGTVGAPNAPNNTDYEDKNGDGAISRDEVKPGSQLEKRFGTRDKNKDGLLTPDEYYVVQKH